MDNWAVLFFGSCLFLVFSIILYIKKDEQHTTNLEREFKELRAQFSRHTLQDPLTTQVINRLNERMDAIDVDIVSMKKAPLAVKLTEPVKVKLLVKHVSAPTLPGDISNIKKHLKHLSQ